MRHIRTIAAAGFVVAACASGTENAGDDDDGVDAPRVDAPSTDAASIDAASIDAASIDAASIDAASIDAASIDAASIDAASIDGAVTDAMVTDAMVTDAPIDAGCTTMVLQRLTNPAFDLTPVGTGWVQTPHNAAFPLITGDDGLAEHTAPYKAWLGGWAEVSSDVMYQQVMIPVGTTQLTVRGQYAVATDEIGSTVYDTCNVELLNSSGGLIQSVMALSNVTTTATWTAFQLTFTSPQAGQTVRLNFRAASDSSFATSCYFDSLALEATVCQ
jgi:hypothetical protein